MTDTKHLNPFQVHTLSVPFDRTCTFTISNVKISLDRAMTAQDLLTVDGITELHDMNGHLLGPTVILHDLHGIRIAMGNRRYLVQFIQTFSFSMTGRATEGVSLLQASVNTIQEVRDFAKQYSSMWFADKNAGLRVNRLLVHSAMTYILSHRYNIERILTRVSHPSYITATTHLFQDMEDARVRQDPTSFRKYIIDKDVYKQWCNLLKIGVSLLEHAEKNWNRV